MQPIHVKSCCLSLVVVFSLLIDVASCPAQFGTLSIQPVQREGSASMSALDRVTYALELAQLGAENDMQQALFGFAWVMSGGAYNSLLMADAWSTG